MHVSYILCCTPFDATFFPVVWSGMRGRHSRMDHRVSTHSGRIVDMDRARVVSMRVGGGGPPMSPYAVHTGPYGGGVRRNRRGRHCRQCPATESDVKFALGKVAVPTHLQHSTLVLLQW